MKYKEKILFKQLVIADSFLKKLIGLLRHRSLTEDMAIVLQQCNSIHTIGMRFPIDVVFLDNDGVVLSITENTRPFRFTSNRRAAHTLEMKAGVSKQKEITVGNQLQWCKTGLYGVFSNV